MVRWPMQGKTIAVKKGSGAASALMRHRGNLMRHQAWVMPASWPFGLAVKADNKELAKVLDNALGALREGGELLKLFQSHGLTLAAP